MEWTWIVIAAAVLVVAVAVAVATLRRRRPGAGVSPGAAPPAADRVRRALQATRRRLGGQLDAALGRGTPVAEESLPALEEALVSSDVGVRLSTELVAHVRARTPPGALPVDVRRALREEVEACLRGDAGPVVAGRPWVVLVAGVNGVGKTTTIGKLAALHAAAGRKVLLVAADTFRAAAIEQLAVWAERTGAELVRQAPGANPAAVVFDGIKAAVARGVDVVLIDTAGRLHTRTNLMDELRKVQRVVAREVPGAPHEVLLVIDATTGQNALAQARTFAEALGVTGIVLTKLDGTARGGVAVAVRQEIGAPIRYVGVGEGLDDLRPFDAREFAEALLGEEDPEPASTGRSA
jgi:fused signal recognition particle receptor